MAQLRHVARELRRANRVATTEAALRSVVSARLGAQESAAWRAALGALEIRGVIRRLPFGGLVLLDIDFLPKACDLLMASVGGEGELTEQVLRSETWRGPMPEGLADKTLWRWLRLAAAVELIDTDRALRRIDAGPPRIVLPDRVRTERPTLFEPRGLARIDFEGSARRIFTAIVVRLSQTGIFGLERVWRQGASWVATIGGHCTIDLEIKGDEGGALLLSFDSAVRRQTRLFFEQFVLEHVEGEAASAERRCVFVCTGCATPITDLQAQRRQERGFDSMACGVCSERIHLEDPILQRPGDPESIVDRLDRAVERRRDRQRSALALLGKRLINDYDILMIHLPSDREAVVKLGEWLEERGALPWLGAWEAPAPDVALPQRVMGRLETIKAAAVIVGRESAGPWIDPSIDRLLNELGRLRCTLIPVILPGCEDIPRLPRALSEDAIIDFRSQQPDPMDALITAVGIIKA